MKINQDTLFEIVTLCEMSLETYRSRHGDKIEMVTAIEVMDKLLDETSVPTLPDEKLYRLLTSLSDAELYELQALLWIGRDTVEDGDSINQESFHDHVTHAKKTASDADADYIYGKRYSLGMYLRKGIIAYNSLIDAELETA